MEDKTRRDAEAADQAFIVAMAKAFVDLTEAEPELLVIHRKAAPLGATDFDFSALTPSEKETLCSAFGKAQATARAQFERAGRPDQEAPNNHYRNQ